MNGSSLLLLIFLVCFVYALVESKHKWKTVLYTAIVMGFVLLVGVGISWAIPRMASAMGTLSGTIMLIGGSITSIAHAKGKIA
jgi:uncharacterized protein YqhQ